MSALGMGLGALQRQMLTHLLSDGGPSLTLPSSVVHTSNTCQRKENFGLGEKVGGQSHSKPPRGRRGKREEALKKPLVPLTSYPADEARAAQNSSQGF